MAARKTRTLRLQVYVAASPKKVFRAVSDADRLTRWFVDTATISTRKGGRYSFGWTDGPTHTGRVLQFVRGKSLTLSWQWPGIEDELTTKLKISVEPKADGAVVRFTHSGFPKTERWADLHAGAIQGWMYSLMNLKSVVEHHRDLRSPHDW